MKRPLDPTPAIDASTHYDPVLLVVEVTIDRDAFDPDEDAEDSAFKVLDDAVQVLNESAYDMAHSVRRVDSQLVIVWQDGDLPEGTDPDFFDWDSVQDRCIEAGNEAINDIAQD